MRKGFGLLISVCLLASCATQEQAIKGQGAAAGAAVGGSVGAIAGQAIGKNTESTALGASIGAAVGGAAGYAYGRHVAREKQALDKRQQRLAAQISRARQVNTWLTSYNRSLEQKTGDVNSCIQLISYKISKSVNKRNERRRIKQNLKAEIGHANTYLSNCKAELRELKKTQRHNPTPELNQEVEKLEKLVLRLRENTQALAYINRRI